MFIGFPNYKSTVRHIYEVLKEGMIPFKVCRPLLLKQQIAVNAVSFSFQMKPSYSIKSL